MTDSEELKPLEIPLARRYRLGGRWPGSKPSRKSISGTKKTRIRGNFPKGEDRLRYIDGARGKGIMVTRSWLAVNRPDYVWGNK